MKTRKDDLDWLLVRLKKQIIADLDVLSQDDRVYVFSHFCCHCGSRDTGCQCWNDE